jgi:lipoate-protein ligase A
MAFYRTLEIHLDVTAGSIDAVRIFGDYFGVRSIGELEAALIGCPHNRSAVAEQIAAFPVGDYLRDVPMQEFLAAIC